jgi:hypothetical protein
MCAAVDEQITIRRARHGPVLSDLPAFMGSIRVVLA